MPNYLKIGFRNLSKNSSYAFINIAGLTIGIASFLMIMIYVQYHLSFDQHIENRNNLYRLVEIQHAEGVGDQHVAVTMAPLAPTMMKDFPEVINFLRVWNLGSVPFEINNKIIKQNRVVFADSSVFDLFNVKLIHGNAKDALAKPKSILLSEETALKYFTSAEEALGKVITYNKTETFIITGVFEDVPENFHVQFKVIASFVTVEELFEWTKGWGSNSFSSYVELSPNTDIEALEAKFPEFLNKYTEQDEKDGGYRFDLYLQPLKEIHLQSGHVKFQWQVNQSDIQIIYIFSIVAFLILFIACINFINIAISRSIKRAKEVGMRKVIGANRMSLIYQFNSESVVLTFLSIILSLGLVELLLPTFNKLLGTELNINFLNNPLFNIGLVGILFFVSLVTGLYPAYYLSKFKPLVVLKGTKGSVKGKTGLLTRILVVFQFTISVALIFVIMVVQKQINYTQNKDLGYNYENVMRVNFFDSQNDYKKIDVIRAELLQNPDIIKVSGAASVTGASGNQSFREVNDTVSKRLIYRICAVDPEYFDLMEIPIVRGRNFSREYARDMKGLSVILNEISVAELGWDDPIGKQFRVYVDDSAQNASVVGVVKDYHYYSLHNKIEPAFFRVDRSRNEAMIIKFVDPSIGSDNKEIAAFQKKNVAYVEKVWRSFFPDASFDYAFVEQGLSREYSQEKNTLSIFTYFAILSILISCLGLYGLIAFVVEQRTNEIGVRKVMGGSVTQILFLLIKDFISLIIIAGVIATPLAIYISNQFLQSFVYRIPMPYVYMVVAIFIALFIAIVTISYHAVRSANANPVDALRYE